MKRFIVAALVLTLSSFSAGLAYLAFGPATAAGVQSLVRGYASVSCSSTNPCQTYTNKGAGPGTQSASTGGYGLIGTTAKSNGPPYTKAYAGVLGTTTASSAGFGVAGISSTGIGVVGISTCSDHTKCFGGVQGISTVQDGVDATTASTTNPALFANNTGGGQVLALDDPSGKTTEMSVDSGGNMYVNGSVTIVGLLSANGGCTGCAKLHKAVQLYPSRASEPILEDLGEARLVNGSTRVRLDPAFAESIAQRSNYLVFITPEGDTRGLFVTRKSLDGFEVRESQGGRSSVDFSYRVVARPFGDASPRLSLVTTERPHRVRRANLLQSNR